MVKVVIATQPFTRILDVELNLPVGFYYGAVRGYAITNPQLFLNTGKGLVFFNSGKPHEAGVSPNEQVNVVAVDVELVVTTRL